MKPFVTAVLVFIAVFVLLSASLGFATHLGYISFEDEPGHVQPSQGSVEPNQQGPILGASVVVPAAFSLPLAAKIAISITVILVLAGFAVGAYLLWQNYQDDIIRVVDPESYNLKLEKEQQDLEAAKEKEKQESDALALKEEQEKQAAADRLWKLKLISLGVSAVLGIILSLVIWASKSRSKNVPKIAKTLYLILILVMPVLAGAVFQSGSLFFVTFFGLVLSCVLTYVFFKIGHQGFGDFWTKGGKNTCVSSILLLVVLLIALFV